MSRLTLAAARHAFFRAHCARIAWEQREYGGRSMDDFTLDDFRIIHSAAASQAIDAVQASLNTYNHATRQWDRPFRRIER